MERLYDRNFALLMVSQVCLVLANSLMAHFNRWIEFLGGQVAQVGAIMGSAVFVGMVLRPWIGQWIDRLGPRMTWLLGGGLYAIGASGNMFLLELSAWVLLLRSCLILGSAIIFTSMLTYVSQTTPASRRAEAIGMLGAGGLVGMLIGPFLGDLFVGSSERGRDDFIMLFATVLAMLILPMTIVFFLRPPVTPRASAVRLYDFVRTVRRFWPGTIVLVCIHFGACMTIPFVFLASYIDEAGLQVGRVPMVALFFWCYAGTAIVMRVGLRRMPDRVGSEKVLMAGLSLMSLGMFCYLLVGPHQRMTFVVPALLCGCGHGLIYHTMTALALGSFPSKVRGTASAFALMMHDVGAVVAAPIYGLIADRWGFDALFLTAGLIAVLVTSLFGYSCFVGRHEEAQLAVSAQVSGDGLK